MSDSESLELRVERYLRQYEDLYGKPAFDDVTSELSLVMNPEPTLTIDLDEPSVTTVDSETEQQMIPIPEQVDPNLADIQTLEALEAYCATLDILKTDLPDTRMVFGTGNPNADLMLIGEAPGAEEDKQGEPFVGRSGQLLTKILAAINFKREDVYIANILKHRPPDNRNPLPEERKRSLPYLIKQIQLVNPKLILCLGKVPTEALLETKASLKELRGKFHPFMDSYEILLTYHPAYLLRDPNKKRDTWEDVQLLRKRYEELGCKP